MTRQDPDEPVQAGPDARSDRGFRLGLIAGAVGALVTAAILAAIVVLLWPARQGASAQEQLAALQSQAAQDQAQVSALRGQLAASDAELAVERAARRTLEDSVAALQAQAGQLRDRLAFYDQLFPAGPAGTVSMRAVEIARVPAGLRYRVLLMRSARPGLAPFVGSLRFVAKGARDGEQIGLPLAPLQAAAAAEAPPQAAVTEASPLVPLEVDQYRNSEGILAVPPDFTPTEVTVEVIQDGAVLVSQQAPVAF